MTTFRTFKSTSLLFWIGDEALPDLSPLLLSAWFVSASVSRRWLGCRIAGPSVDDLDFWRFFLSAAASAHNLMRSQKLLCMSCWIVVKVFPKLTWTSELFPGNHTFTYIYPIKLRNCFWKFALELRTEMSIYANSGTFTLILAEMLINVHCPYQINKIIKRKLNIYFWLNRMTGER